jgi:hypothetical protein
MVLPPLNGGGATLRSFEANLNLLVQKCLFQVSGPSTTVGDRTVTRDKLKTVRKRAVAKKGRTGGKGQTTRKSGEERLGKETKWDEDDVMLFFWGNQEPLRNGTARRPKKTLNAWSGGRRAFLMFSLQPVSAVDSFVRMPSLPQLFHFVQHSLYNNLLSS